MDYKLSEFEQESLNNTHRFILPIEEGEREYEIYPITIKPKFNNQLSYFASYRKEQRIFGCDNYFERIYIKFSFYFSFNDSWTVVKYKELKQWYAEGILSLESL